MNKLDEKINQVYEYIASFIKENGYSPTVRDICFDLKIKSTASVHLYIDKLQNKGLLDKPHLKRRAISLSEHNNYVNVPLLGTIRAGSPILAVENLEGYYALPNEFANGNEFALKVRGNSMINAGIYDGDIIIVNQQNTANNGEIVVALIDDSATVKRLYKKKDKVVLHPENDEMEDMVFDEIIVLGVVKGLFRKF